MKKTGAILIIYNLREQRAEILKKIWNFFGRVSKKKLRDGTKSTIKIVAVVIAILVVAAIAIGRVKIVIAIVIKV